jgi:hypothetical protein
MTATWLGRWALPGLLLVTLRADPVAAQWDVGLGLGVSNTRQNAISMGGTVNAWNVHLPMTTLPITVRLYADAELAIRDFKEGLYYDDPTDPDDRRYQIADNDGAGTPQWPNENDLWQLRGWDIHTGLYGTVQWCPTLYFGCPYLSFLSVGGGGSYNGLDHSLDGDFLNLVVLRLSSRCELDIEFLDFPGRWRARLALDFWRF